MHSAFRDRTCVCRVSGESPALLVRPNEIPGGFGVVNAFELQKASVVSQLVVWCLRFHGVRIPGIWICITFSATVAQMTGSGMDVSEAFDGAASFETAYLT